MKKVYLLLLFTFCSQAFPQCYSSITPKGFHNLYLIVLNTNMALSGNFF